GDYPRPDKLTKFTVRRDTQYQKVLGYGGAFTDAAGINIGMLSQPTQENLMKSYFGEDGIDYSMGRVPIGGTDFSTRPYTYDDDVQDLGGVDANLTKFALQPEDFKLKIPYIQWAQQLSGNKVKLVASPWSAPGWMKTSGRIHGMGQLKKQFYQQWADYFVKFLEAYKNQDVDVWGITTGNEPFNGYIPMWPFNCMGWKAADMRRFLANNLGPSLAAAKLDPRVIMLDDNKGSVQSWAKEILSQNDSAQYVHGVGTHWYLDFLTSPDVLSRFHNNYPDYFIVQTEACLGFTPWEREKVSLGNWERGEQYLEAIIQDSRNFVGGWIDWNLALDLKGGPNWAKLKADAAILVNATADEFLKQPIYYGIGHVSKFVPPDSVRIDMTADSFSPRGLQTVAFLRPDNGTAILRYDAKIVIQDAERGAININIPQQSFVTMLYW
ncbi:putative glucosylceramidase 4, partial [Orchesella cincta]